ncbi:hypothetical protein [Solidesulfovibrio alcoholivorans]|uniref:hypothetical protein n=1 Tax=Solidesulfovibrio alcoholivorans TaxID=81406 RepID=UPI0012EC55B7|nr:hypothetical protein [Solidesulfovibrio alcoholivorans]
MEPSKIEEGKPRHGKAQALLCTIICLVVVVAGFVVAEIVFRLHNGIPLRWDMPGLYQDDPVLGWRVRPGYKAMRQSKDCAGQPVTIDMHTAAMGFRDFGDLTASRKLLVVGDSFTLNRDVSDGQTYTAVLGNLLGCAVFAAGGGGYGSLQEALLLEESLPRIDPDVILVQLHINDVINNDYELERQSVINNNYHARPYLSKDGSIVMATPAYHWTQTFLDGLGRLFDNHSQIILAIQHNLQMALLAKFNKVSIENHIEKGQDVPAYLRSLDTTKRVFERICSTANGIPVYAFILGGGRISRDITDILDGTCVKMIRDVDAALSTNLPGQPSFFAEDCAHLSAYGNARLAEELKTGLMAGPEGAFAPRALPSNPGLSAR